jgi:amidase
MKAAVNLSSVQTFMPLDVSCVHKEDMCIFGGDSFSGGWGPPSYIYRLSVLSLYPSVSVATMTIMSFQEKIKGVGGDASYEAKARVLREQLEAKIPASLRLPPATLEYPPLDVTRIPEACGLLTPAELAITELDATAVCQKIAAGELTAVEAVTAFGKRAAIAHQLTACLVDFFLDEGIKQAQQLDEYFKKEGKVIGPLHGLPISVKVSTTLKS